ncbi:hypothetical protein GN316_12505 [Xylophilus sp. Kf1]|nr:hypothetical protein [Xylophilus sp. Kf1]
MTLTTPGMLFVATDVDPLHEAEFNQWYDREHVEERARIEGFVSAARYRSVSGGRRYLGLYRTESLGAFTSDAYRAAFGQQTRWSVTNLDRMVDPMRRVCAVAAPVGQGSGRNLSVVTLNPADAGVSDSATPVEAAAAAQSLTALAARVGAGVSALPGFVRCYLLLPDAGLSSPLPRESTEGRRLLPLWVIETSDDDADAAALAQALPALGAAGSEVAHYTLGWKLFASELA